MKPLACLYSTWLCLTTVSATLLLFYFSFLDFVEVLWPHGDFPRSTVHYKAGASPGAALLHEDDGILLPFEQRFIHGIAIPFLIAILALFLVLLRFSSIARGVLGFCCCCCCCRLCERCCSRRIKDEGKKGHGRGREGAPTSSKHDIKKLTDDCQVLSIFAIGATFLLYQATFGQYYRGRTARQDYLNYGKVYSAPLRKLVSSEALFNYRNTNNPPDEQDHDNHNLYDFPGAASATSVLQSLPLAIQAADDSNLVKQAAQDEATIVLSQHQHADSGHTTPRAPRPAPEEHNFADLLRYSAKFVNHRSSSFSSAVSLFNHQGSRIKNIVGILEDGVSVHKFYAGVAGMLAADRRKFRRSSAEMNGDAAQQVNDQEAPAQRVAPVPARVPPAPARGAPRATSRSKLSFAQVNFKNIIPEQLQLTSTSSPRQALDDDAMSGGSTSARQLQFKFSVLRQKLGEAFFQYQMQCSKRTFSFLLLQLYLFVYLLFRVYRTAKNQYQLARRRRIVVDEDDYEEDVNAGEDGFAVDATVLPIEIEDQELQDHSINQEKLPLLKDEQMQKNTATQSAPPELLDPEMKGSSVVVPSTEGSGQENSRQETSTTSAADEELQKPAPPSTSTTSTVSSSSRQSPRRKLLVSQKCLLLLSALWFFCGVHGISWVVGYLDLRAIFSAYSHEPTAYHLPRGPPTCVTDAVAYAVGKQALLNCGGGLLLFVLFLAQQHCCQKTKTSFWTSMLVLVLMLVHVAFTVWSAKEESVEVFEEFHDGGREQNLRRGHDDDDQSLFYYPHHADKKRSSLSLLPLEESGLAIPDLLYDSKMRGGFNQIDGPVDLREAFAGVGPGDDPLYNSEAGARAAGSSLLTPPSEDVDPPSGSAVGIEHNHAGRLQVERQERLQAYESWKRLTHLYTKLSDNFLTIPSFSVCPQVLFLVFHFYLMLLFFTNKNEFLLLGELEKQARWNQLAAEGRVTQEMNNDNYALSANYRNSGNHGTIAAGSSRRGASSILEQERNKNRDRKMLEKTYSAGSPGTTRRPEAQLGANDNEDSDFDETSMSSSVSSVVSVPRKINLVLTATSARGAAGAANGMVNDNPVASRPTAPSFLQQPASSETAAEAAGNQTRPAAPFLATNIGEPEQGLLHGGEEDDDAGYYTDASV
ncbi:unnamed protein product [Amoebophrya sp. A120]|nr:unnamed protein product [Amoebophrya sp. A120]|eukprot:GSA120T00007239001.1